MNRLSQTALSALILCGGTALGARAEDWKPAPNALMTRWAKDVDPAHPLPEYPRPQMVRKEWINLNGLWDYSIVGEHPATGKVLVPFCIESALSGVKRSLSRQDQLHYARTFTLPDLAEGQRVLLHFGAVDWACDVLVNGKGGGPHKGGYDAFTFDITDSLYKGVNQLTVHVGDPTGANGSAHGKQRVEAFAKPGGIFYTPCSGIWQTVWLEIVESSYVEGLTITPDVEAGSVMVRAKVHNMPPNGKLKVEAMLNGEVVSTATGPGPDIQLKLQNAKLWSPNSPTLYDLHVALLDPNSKKTDGERKDPTVDSVTSYFAMRKISLGKDEKGATRLMLNNKPIFMAGPLDQGFWPDGIYTAPTDAALKYDIEVTKKLGFNCTRKHVKVEPERWYYWCDKLGLLVWQDMPSGGVAKNTKRAGTADGVASSPEAAKQFETELRAMIEQHRNHPSIAMWVVFNEGWGQYDTKRITDWVKFLDPTRLVNDASGWVDQGVGDVHDMHHYPAPSTYAPEEKRAAVLGEFGGLGLPVAGHQWVASAWGYQNMADASALTRKYIELWREVWRLRKEKGLSAAIYTQLTDVETESNGLLTYDRKVIKVDVEKAAAAVAKAEFPPPGHE